MPFTAANEISDRFSGMSPLIVHGIGAKRVPTWLGSKKFYIPKVSILSVEKGYLFQAWKCHFQYVNVYFTDYNIKQRRDPMKLHFEVPEMQK